MEGVAKWLREGGDKSARRPYRSMSKPSVPTSAVSRTGHLSRKAAELAIPNFSGEMPASAIGLSALFPADGTNARLHVEATHYVLNGAVVAFGRKNLGSHDCLVSLGGVLRCNGLDGQTRVVVNVS